MPLSPRSKRLTLWTTLALLWIASYLVYEGVQNRRDSRSSACFDDDYHAPSVTPSDVIDLGVTEEVLVLDFGQSRGVRRDQIRIDTAADAPAHAPAQLEVAPSDLTGDRGTLPAELVRTRAKSLRDTILLDACLDLRGADQATPGSYSGVIVFTDPRVSALSVPLTVTTQARYLWLLAPLMLAFPMLGLYLVWTGTVRSTLQKDPRIVVTTLISSFAASATVFGVQGVQNLAWGGLLAVAAIVASMYTAAVGVTATLGASRSK